MLKKILAFHLIACASVAFAQTAAEEGATSTELSESREPTRYDSIFVNSDGSSTFIGPHFFRAGVRYPLYSPYTVSPNGTRFDPDIERLSGICRYLGLSKYIERREVRDANTIAVQLNANGLFEELVETRRYFMQGIILEITCR